MDAMILRGFTMHRLLKVLRLEFPAIQFVEGATCSWSPRNRIVYFVAGGDPADVWGLLHELGHALLDHTTYQTDVELLRKEASAWEKARELAKHYDITIQEEHIQDCLDSYRDWINKRSQCPHCGVKTISDGDNAYLCFNCQTAWTVSPARHHRPYRRTQKIAR